MDSKLKQPDKNRKIIRLSHELYQQSDQPFSITICTFNKIPIFQNEIFVKPIFENIVRGPLSSEAELFAVCLMPDHIHLLIAPKNNASLVKIIDRWKSFSTNLLHRQGYEGPVWQRSFYDHALRKEENIKTVSEYIVQNPIRRGLVDKWEKYSYSWHRWQ
jgi:REP element-mobilizing transposase RayT